MRQPGYLLRVSTRQAASAAFDGLTDTGNEEDPPEEEELRRQLLTFEIGWIPIARVDIRGSEYAFQMRYNKNSCVTATAFWRPIT